MESNNTTNTAKSNNTSLSYEDVNEKLEAKSIKFESYNDYPDSASNNACKVLRWIDKYGRDEVKGMTRVGITRANQLCSKSNISRDTISRMASFKRHQQNKDVPYSEGCGGLMWDAWGGASGINSAINKLKQIDKK